MREDRTIGDSLHRVAMHQSSQREVVSNRHQPADELVVSLSLIYIQATGRRRKTRRPIYVFHIRFVTNLRQSLDLIRLLLFTLSNLSIPLAGE